jgi:hypothetical protein
MVNKTDTVSEYTGEVVSTKTPAGKVIKIHGGDETAGSRLQQIVWLQIRDS